MRMNTDPKQRAGKLVGVPQVSVALAVLGWLCAGVASSSKVGALLHTPSLHVTVKDYETCSNCKSCTKICPMSIAVSDHIQTKTKLPNNCIQCGLCVDTCPQSVLAFSFGIEQ